MLHICVKIRDIVLGVFSFSPFLKSKNVSFHLRRKI
jgi:hypothetical protein